MLLLTIFLQSIENIDMVYVKSGTFYMGSDIDEKYRKKDEELHFVIIKKDFYIDRYEITQEQFKKIMGFNPSIVKGGNFPVTNIDWYDTIEFCNSLSIKEELQPYYLIDKKSQDPNNLLKQDRKRWKVEVNKNSKGYRLPTEEEWEFAARGGVKSKYFLYSGSNDQTEVAVLKGEGKLGAVGGKKPNELGLYDMTGNALEWCYNWYSLYSEDNSKGNRKVLRGGSWLHSPYMSRIAKRFYRRADYGDEVVGLRIVKNIP